MSSLSQAVVLAGGRGTRLGALTDRVPKPLLPVGGRPFLDWLIDLLRGQGVERVVLTTGYRAEAFEAWLEASPSGVDIEVHVEGEPLGTGGALSLLTDRLEERFLVLNGDTLFDVDLARVASGLEGPGTEGVVALRSVPDTGRYGRVTLEGGRITGFTEKGEGGPGLINGGVYAFRREALAGLACPSSIERDLLPALAAEGALAGVASDGFFLDIGVPSAYEEAQTAVPARWAGRAGA